MTQFYVKNEDGSFSPAASVQADKQIIADANAYQFLKRHAFNSTRRGFDGPYVCWTLEIPASNEETDSLDSAIAHEIRYTGWAPPYTAPTQPDSGRDTAPAQGEALSQEAVELDPDCNYMMTAGRVCNKCGRVHRGIGGHRV